MWELVRANKRRSVLLLFLMLLLMLALGFAIGSALAPSFAATEFNDDELAMHYRFSPVGGLIGLGVAFVLWGVQSLVAYFQGDSILLAVSRATAIEKSDHPRLFNVVEEMTIASRLPKMPRIYVIEDMSLNAFATGRNPETASVAVTAGLLGRLNRDQLQGVIAHEITHIVNRDVLFMTMVGIMVGTIVMLSEVFLRSLRFAGAGGSRRFSGKSKGGGGAQLALILLAVVLAIVAPLLAQVMYFALSRRREYLADAGAAIYTRYPEGLASALEIITTDKLPLASANRATAPMYIVNPLHAERSFSAKFMGTHPPASERIKILRALSGGVSYAKYQAAWRTVSGRGGTKIPGSGLAQQAQAIRPATPEEAPQSPRNRMREAGDLLRKMNHYLFLTCVCGMRIKLPPDFKQDHVQCPRCGKEATVPTAHLIGLAAAGDALAQHGPLGQAATPTARARKEAAPQEVVHTGKGWQSFKCVCGAVKNLGPSFSAPRTSCDKCGRAIQVKRA